MNILGRLILFASSYAPLSILFFVQYVGKNNVIAIASLSVGLLSVIMVSLLLTWWKQDGEATHDEVIEYRRPGAEVMGYMAGYVLPFLDFSPADIRSLLLLLVYLLTLAYLYITTDMIRVNPTLNLILRYGIYEVELKEYGFSWLIARGDIRRGRRLRVVSMGHGLVIQKDTKCTNKSNS